MAKRVRILDANVPEEARRAFKPLVKSRLLDLERRMVPRMKLALFRYVQDVVETTLKSTPLQSKSGRMAKSLRGGIRVTGTRLDTLRAQVFAPGYVAAHEFGAVIKPVNASVLTLPMPAALRADGTPKLRSARSWKRFGTFSWQSPTGRGYLAYKDSQNNLVLLYMYIDQVEILPRLGLRRTYSSLLADLMAAWGSIMIQEMADTDIFAIPARKGITAKEVRRRVSGRFRPRVIRR